MKEMDDLRHVSSSAIGAASRRYFTNMRFVYLGDTTLAGRDLREALLKVGRP
jgi:hypothetical protein